MIWCAVLAISLHFVSALDRPAACRELNNIYLNDTIDVSVDTVKRLLVADAPWFLTYSEIVNKTGYGKLLTSSGQHSVETSWQDQLDGVSNRTIRYTMYPGKWVKRSPVVEHQTWTQTSEGAAVLDRVIYSSGFIMSDSFHLEVSVCIWGSSTTAHILVSESIIEDTFTFMIVNLNGDVTDGTKANTELYYSGLRSVLEELSKQAINTKKLGIDDDETIDSISTTIAMTLPEPGEDTVTTAITQVNKEEELTTSKPKKVFIHSTETTTLNSAIGGEIEETTSLLSTSTEIATTPRATQRKSYNKWVLTAEGELRRQNASIKAVFRTIMRENSGDESRRSRIKERSLSDKPSAGQNELREYMEYTATHEHEPPKWRIVFLSGIIIAVIVAMLILAIIIKTQNPPPLLHTTAASQAMFEMESLVPNIV